MINLTSSQLRQAADLQDKIEALQTELDQLIGNSAAVVPAAVASIAAPKKRGRPRKEVAPVVVKQSPEPAKRGPKKGGMSAAGRAAIAAAQKARWAKVKSATKATIAEQVTSAMEVAETKPSKKRKMSAAGKAAIAAAAKARWAKFRAGKK